MRLFRCLLLGYFCAACLSCQKKDTTLEVTLSPTSVFLIDSTAKSCKDVATGATTDGVTNSFIRFRKIQLRWTGTASLGLSYIRLSGRSDNLSQDFNCVISGEEMEYLFNIVQDDLIAPGASVKGPSDTGTDCKLICGGIALIDPKRPTNIMVNVEVVGYATDGNSEEPVHGYTQIAVRSQ